jgi:FkbM family methyltransferase
MHATMTIKKVLRTGQSLMPFAADAKATAQAAGRRLLRRPHERDFLAFRDFAVDGPSVVDVGANRGQSVASFEVTCRSPRIVAFEPLPILARRLRARSDADRVRVEQYALGNTHDHATLYVPIYRGYVYDGLASLDKTEAHWLNRDRVYRFRLAQLKLEEYEVEVRPLDSFDLRPDIVKIDVQGTEQAVVEGGVRTLEQSRPVLLIEAPSVELIALVQGLGYEYYAFTRRGLVPGALGDPNTFFITPDRLDQFDRAIRP